VTIDEFIAVPEVLRIFQDAAITDCKTATFCLEQYKFTTRSRIIETLSGYSGDPVLDINGVSRDGSLESLEKQYHVIAEAGTEKQLVIYYPFFDPPRKEPLELQMDRYRVSYIAVTPYNFAVLTGREPSWDAEMLFKRILIEAVNLRATDLHFCVGHENLVPRYPVKYRKNGELLEMGLFTLDAHLNQKIISQLIENKTSANSIDLQTASGVTAVADDPLGNGKLELRISANKVEGGWHYVIRIQTKEVFNFEIGSLGFPEGVQDALHRMTKKRSGIVFITGGIRTGKNTTAFAMANEMTKDTIKIVSYEFPIEVLMPFPQVNYRGKTDILLNSVRLAKKQDIDVAFINELPDKEVAFAVQDLVNSSVYVITTIHIDRLWHLPYKLKEYYGEDYKDIISQINAVFNQKMFAVPCRECQNRKLVADLEMGRRMLLEKHGVASYGESTGCTLCGGTGVQSGVNQPYVEYLIFTNDLKSSLLACREPFEMEAILKEEAIRKGQSLEFTMSAAIGDGRLGVDALDSIL